MRTSVLFTEIIHESLIDTHTAPRYEVIAEQRRRAALSFLSMRKMFGPATLSLSLWRDVVDNIDRAL